MRDEDIASATVCSITLADTSAFRAIREQVRSGIEQLLDVELERNPIPLRRPAYAVLFLVAAQVVGAAGPHVRQAA